MRWGPLYGLVLGLGWGCGSKTPAEAETSKDVSWLADHATGDAVAALGRLSDTEPRALAVLESRADTDVNVYIAAWSAITRSAAWGTTFLRAALANPARAELASTAMPRRDPQLAPFVVDLENAIVRLAAGHRGSVLAGVLASIGPAAHVSVERRLVEAKTRGAMCDGIALPEASSDAKATLLAVKSESRDHPSCVALVMDLAATEDAVVDWIATGGEPGLLGVAAKSTLACPRLASIWKKAMTARPPDAAMTVPLQRSIARCTSAMDPVLAEILARAPRARPMLISALDPFGTELANLKDTCAALSKGYASGESPIVRERASDALAHGCRLAR